MSPDALGALPYVVAALIATTVASLLLTPIAIRLAPRLGAIDVPNDARRVHSRPIPRTGGLAVALSFVGVGALGLLANQFFHLTLPGRQVRTTEVAALFAGVIVGAAFGYLDDRLQLKARWQFIAQFALAGIALVGGVLINRLPEPLGPITDAAAMAATTIWIVGMLNSVNFVDGLDGLLAGISLIAVTTLGINSLFVAPIQPVVAMLCALMAGALLGFLPYNFHPARVFIGTSGVFAVGYALAVLSVLGTAKVALALLVLGVPIIDTFWIILRRMSQRRSPFSADRGHFHHRLLDLGLSHRQAVLLIYLICSVLAVLSFLLPSRGQFVVFIVIVLGGGALLYLLTRRAREALDRSSYDENGAGDGSEGGSAGAE
ncbi:MAG TPA: MraY family glycosyltransferase [Candidatus Limnocylindria bacterium]|nr:MraY family glycosyltransferase [Candidatus Limnocylindria bacterium]